MAVATDTGNMDFGTAVSAGTPATHMLWLRRTAAANGKIIINRSNRSPQVLTDSTDEASFKWDCTGGTDMLYVSSDSPLAVNGWCFLALVGDFNATPQGHIYHGTLNSIAVESTYATSTDGTGSFKTGTAFQIGGASGTNFKGEFALVHFVRKAMTLSKIRAQQFRPHVLPESELFVHCGFHGVSSFPDLTGGGNNGTQTGTLVLKDHCPISPPFGLDGGWPGAFTPAGGGGGLSIPVAMRTYRSRRVA